LKSITKIVHLDLNVVAEVPSPKFKRLPMGQIINHCQLLLVGSRVALLFSSHLTDLLGDFLGLTISVVVA
jgi:hypothetical protein